MKVYMMPRAAHVRNEGGIRQVLLAYEKYLPEFGIEFVDAPEHAELIVTHAGAGTIMPDVAILHGLYWTADYNASAAEYQTNGKIVEQIRHALQVTVPSNWVGDAFRRDMHLTPAVIEHGIDWEDWQGDYVNMGYVLWNKNRFGDVCDPIAVETLAKIFPELQFVTTFAREENKSLPNLTVTGVVTHETMKGMVQQAGVYLATTKETFGIGTLEALASGVPVLCWDEGGNAELVIHKHNGYRATPGDYDDLAQGLAYCILNREELSESAREFAKEFTWQRACFHLSKVFQLALDEKQKKKEVSIIIPCHNKEKWVENTILSALAQNHRAKEIIVVLDRSTDGSKAIVERLANEYEGVSYYVTDFGNVALARNYGAEQSTGDLLVFLDADDMIAPEFVSECYKAFEVDQSLSIGYTRIKAIYPDGAVDYPAWPSEFKAEQQMNGNNQVPTCCMIKRTVFERLGGYRPEYAPSGAGSEDANLWMRATAHGYKIQKISDERLFLYSWGVGQVTGSTQYREVNYYSAYPFARNIPFASLVKPKRQSHPVRQYDQPKVSVIIPVGKNHYDCMLAAIDSVEKQTYHNWEIIVCFDYHPSNKELNWLEISRPFVEITITDEPQSGPGAARNCAAEIAKSSMLVFLDADDTLHENALMEMLNEWNRHQAIVYTDYIGIVQMDCQYAKSQHGNKLIECKNGIAKYHYSAAEYDYDRAIQQPIASGHVYTWCCVTCLVPKVWHNSIGGFDPTLETWEDLDYYWRLARHGYCFSRIEKPLLYYSFDKGSRRELSLEIHNDMRKKLRKKYEEVPIMSCNCGGKKKKGAQALSKTESMTLMNDNDYRTVEYLHPNRGQHAVVGPITKTKYGHHGGGGIIPNVHISDINAAPNLFRIIPQAEQAIAPVPSTNAKSAALTESLREEIRAKALEAVKRVVAEPVTDDEEESDEVTLVVTKEIEPEEEEPTELKVKPRGRPKKS